MKRIVDFSTSHTKLIITCFSALLISQFTGCGGGGPTDTRPKGTASGQVTVDGQPASGGSVRFALTANEGFSADIDSSGNYKFDTPIPAGSYKVAIIPAIPGPQTGPDGEPIPFDPATLNTKIPEKYRDPDKSGLAAEITEGDNAVPAFDLKP